MRSTIRNVMLVLILLSVVTGCNVLEDFGNQNTDEARFVEAKKMINQGLYSEAILQFQAMSESFLSKPEVKSRYASAYAGRCGLDFISFVTSLKDMGSNRLFQFLMKGFPGATIEKIEDCVQAQDLLLEISEFGSSRSIDENFLMTFVSFVKVGSVLATYADADHNGSPDAGFNSCDNTDLPEDFVRQIGSSIIHTYSSLMAIGDQDDVADGALNQIKALLNTVDASYDLCNDTPDGSGDCTNTDPADFNAADLRAIRTFVGESNAIGIGSCTGDFAACACP